MRGARVVCQVLPVWAESHGGKILRRPETYIFPWLGETPIPGLQPLELLACVE